MAPKRSEKEWENHQFDYENQGSSSFQSYVIKRMLNHKPSIALVKVAKANRNGVSDLLLCVLGRFVAIELKVGSNTATPHQLDFIEKIKRTGGIGGVAYTWGEVKALIRQAGYEIGET